MDNLLFGEIYLKENYCFNGYFLFNTMYYIILSDGSLLNRWNKVLLKGSIFDEVKNRRLIFWLTRGLGDWNGEKF